ncbi:MAG: DoxX family protein [Deltaproteobacteria bacterium]|nr:DoxX family protein [Deltaproteobacteria bacterium]
MHRYRDGGVLFLRLGLGIAFLFHGIPKITGGPEKWAELGSAMGSMGITLYPVLWGFLAALSETVGGMLLILGLYFRTACLFLAMTMAVALQMHIRKGDPFAVYSHALEDGIVFLALLLIGPGKYVLKK